MHAPSPALCRSRNACVAHWLGGRRSCGDDCDRRVPDRQQHLARDDRFPKRTDLALVLPRALHWCFSLIRQRYEDAKKHSFVYFFDERLGLVNKPPAFMGSRNCKCPESWAPAGTPAGVYDATGCTCTDLNDWPPQYQDGYKICNISTVAE